MQQRCNVDTVDACTSIEFQKSHLDDDAIKDKAVFYFGKNHDHDLNM